MGLPFVEHIKNCVELLGLKESNKKRTTTAKVMWQEYIRKLTILLLYDRINSNDFQPKTLDDRYKAAFTSDNNIMIKFNEQNQQQQNDKLKYKNRKKSKFSSESFLPSVNNVNNRTSQQQLFPSISNSRKQSKLESDSYQLQLKKTHNPQKLPQIDTNKNKLKYNIDKLLGINEYDPINQAYQIGQQKNNRKVDELFELLTINNENIKADNNNINKDENDSDYSNDNESFVIHSKDVEKYKKKDSNCKFSSSSKSSLKSFYSSSENLSSDSNSNSDSDTSDSDRKRKKHIIFRNDKNSKQTGIYYRALEKWNLKQKKELESKVNRSILYKNRSSLNNQWSMDSQNNVKKNMNRLIFMT
jgi:hypothetical protein